MFRSKKIALIAVAALLAAGAAHAQWDVTITNATANQIFSPPIVVSHGQNMSLWSIGQPAGDELAAVAEDADPTALLDLLDAAEGVRDYAIAGGVLLPGESVTLSVARGGRLTVLGMLVTPSSSLQFTPLWRKKTEGRCGKDFFVDSPVGAL